MINKINFFLVIISFIFFTGCASNGYKEFYTPFDNEKELLALKNNPNYSFLKKDEEPKLIYSKNLEKDIKDLERKHFYQIGYSSFNGGLEDIENLKSQAKKIGALIALYTSKFTNTQTNSGTLVLPQTNYYSGSVYSNNGIANFNGTNTSSTFVPFSNTQRRYDQEAIFFIKSNEKQKFGLSFINISREEQIKIGKNGVIVDIIYEDTPVYYSQLLEGDIITQIDNIDIKNAKQVDDILADYDTSKGICTFTIIRNNEIKEIEIRF
ncbi:hypothetical protein CRU92_06200 [Arcobacter sp. FW59]|nr:hypothetical protein CRU92_06200 [Arcobacter sp. FW59]